MGTNADRLAIGSAEGTIELWDLPRHEPSGYLRGHVGKIQRLAFSPDDSRLVSASSDGTAKIWNMNQLPPVDFVDFKRGHILDVAIERSGRMAAVSGWGWVELLDIDTRKRRELVGDGFNGTNVQVSPTADLLVTRNGRRPPTFWQVPDGKQDVGLTELTENLTSCVSIAFSRNRKVICLRQ